MAPEFPTQLLGASAVRSDRNVGETVVFLNTHSGPLIGSVGGPDTQFSGQITELLFKAGQRNRDDAPYDPEGEMER